MQPNPTNPMPRKKVRHKILKDEIRIEGIINRRVKKIKLLASKPRRRIDSSDLDEVMGNADNQAPLLNPVPLNFLKRTRFEARETDVWKAFVHGKANLANIYEYVSSLGYFIPPLKSKPISINYCIGVCEKHYFAPMNINSIPMYTKRISRHIYYYEIVRTINQPLGYDNNNLPPVKYLTQLLYAIEPNHYFFSPNKHLNLPMNPETGIYLVPESCQGYLKLNNTTAMISTRAAYYNNRTLDSELNNSATIVRYVESIKEMISKFRQKIPRTPYTADIFIKQIIAHFKGM